MQVTNKKTPKTKPHTQQKSKSRSATKQGKKPASVEGLSTGVYFPETDDSTQANFLNNTHIPLLQRQKMASQMGKLAGNHYLQEVMLQRKGSQEPNEQKATQLDYPTLKIGSSGLFVLILQSALNELGVSLQTDGKYGQHTRSAVFAFQSSNNLKIDGVVGSQTWGELSKVTDIGNSNNDLQEEFHTNSFSDTSKTEHKPTQAPLQGDKTEGKDAQATSWFNEKEPFGMKLVGATFFPTNSADLDSQDRAELDKFVDLVSSQETTPFNPQDRPLIVIAGNTDPRKTARKGGNPKLSRDRAFAVYKYLEFRMDKVVGAIWKERIELIWRGYGTSEGLKTFGHEFMRSALLVRVRGKKLKPGRKITTPKLGRARARDVLRKHKKKFQPNEWRRLWHICQDSTTDDGFLKSTDPEFQKVNAKGRPSKMWPYSELKKFVNRHNVTTYLTNGAGSSASDEEIIGVLKDIHVHADQAIYEMHTNQKSDDGLPFDMPTYAENQRRKQLINWVADGTKTKESFYFNWGPAQSH